MVVNVYVLIFGTAKMIHWREEFCSSAKRWTEALYIWQSADILAQYI